MPVYWPGGARHEGGASPVCGFRMERGKASADTVPGGAGCERERAGQPKLEALSTVAALAGGPARISAEAPVMGVERRGRLIWICSHGKPGCCPWEETREQVEVAGKAVRDTEAARVGGV